MPHVPEDDPRLLRALELKGRVGDHLLRFRNVTGLGVGLREVGGQVTDEVAIRVYVARKIPRDRLEPDELLPSEVEGIHVDVIEAKFRAHDDPGDHQVRHQLLRGGISVGNILLGGSGTLAASVFDKFSGQQMILSNWHVFCGRFDCEIGEHIVQPGTGGGDAGTSSDIVARLARWQLDEHVDGAVAVLSGHRFCSDELFHLGRISTRLHRPTLGLAVQKSGRTTGVTSGQITDVSAGVNVDYGGTVGTRKLTDQLIIRDGKSVSLPGDSGSLWVDDEMRPVGLNFAGGSGDYGVANRIENVVDALGISFGPGFALHDYPYAAVAVG